MISAQQVTQLDERKLWRAVLAELQLTLSELTFKTWLANTEAQNLTEKSVEIVCPSSHAKTVLEKTCRSLIQESVNKIGQGNYELTFRVGSIKESTAKDTPAPLFESINESQTGPTKKVREDTNLSPRYTFENYIRGNNNQLAYSIAWAVATNPGVTYNPVFIYSGVGLGKTHLIQAIGNKIIQEKPQLKVIYTTGESFANELIEAIRSGKGRGKYSTNEFRNKYRNVDVLLLDDIQFIAGRESTQGEFFHTFNTLYMAQKQIVMTSDRPPKDFVDLEERIRSRFSSGIIADIQSPDIDIRAAILRHRRDIHKDNISNEIIDLIARKVDTNIRELEGAYMQVLTYAQAQGLPVNLEIAASALGQTIPGEKQRQVNVNQVLKAVCNYYSVKGGDLKGKRRTKDLVIPRQIAMYLIKEMTAMPLMSIGDFLGGRDHTTILHGIRKVEAEIKEVEKTQQDVSNVKQLIYQG